MGRASQHPNCFRGPRRRSWALRTGAFGSGGYNRGDHISVAAAIGHQRDRAHRNADVRSRARDRPKHCSDYRSQRCSGPGCAGIENAASPAGRRRNRPGGRPSSARSLENMARHCVGYCSRDLCGVPDRSAVAAWGDLRSPLTLGHPASRAINLHRFLRSSAAIRAMTFSTKRAVHREHLLPWEEDWKCHHGCRSDARE